LITLDGVSLTVAELDGCRGLGRPHPHTLAVTTMGIRGIGDSVNLEMDTFGKWVRQLFERSTFVSARKRAFSGIQPTGKVHLGNLLGAIRNWVELQDVYDCTFCIVDWHAMTVDDDPSQMRARILDCAVALIAAGARSGNGARCSCSRTCPNIPNSPGIS
jgi:hypothetical protein